jgi:hypothetical protein
MYLNLFILFLVFIITILLIIKVSPNIINYTKEEFKIF